MALHSVLVEWSIQWIILISMQKVPRKNAVKLYRYQNNTAYDTSTPLWSSRKWWNFTIGTLYLYFMACDVDEDVDIWSFGTHSYTSLIELRWRVTIWFATSESSCVCCCKVFATHSPIVNKSSCNNRDIDKIYRETGRQLESNIQSVRTWLIFLRIFCVLKKKKPRHKKWENKINFKNSYYMHLCQSHCVFDTSFAYFPLEIV